MHRKHILTIFFITFIIGITIFMVNGNINKKNVESKLILTKKEEVTKKNDKDNNVDNNDKSYKIELIRNGKTTSNSKIEPKKTEKLYIPSFTVYFDYNGGTLGIESKQVIYNQEYGKLPTPTKKGHTFIGWYTKKDSGEKIESNTKEIIKENHTLYAHYIINDYFITYDYNYLENNLYKKTFEKSYWNINNFEILMGDSIFLNENVYKFTIDNKDTTLEYSEKLDLENGKTYTYSIYIKTNSEKELLIGFEDDLININTNSVWMRFTKTFKANDNDYSKFIFKLPDNSLWNIDDTIEIYGLSISEKDINKKIEEKKYNEKLGELDNPIRDGYEFDGWYTDFTFSEKINSDTLNSDLDKTYYAKWIPKLYTLRLNLNNQKSKDNLLTNKFIQGYNTIKKLDEPKNIYKITYDLNGSNGVNSKKEDIIIRPFKGWVDKDNKLLFNNTYIFTKDTELTANYEENINVKLDSITRDDYTCYWNKSKDGNGDSYNSGSEIKINNDITLYAICKKNKKFTRPLVTGYVTSEYGNRIHPIYNTKKFHSGLDMSGNDRNIYSIADGVVAKTGNNSSMGNYIIIHHNINNQNYTSAYYHLEIKNVKKGEYVTNDTVIGKMGQTGAATGIHLHLTMYKGHLYKESTTMVNPRDYLNFPSKLYSRWQDKIS